VNRGSAIFISLFILSAACVASTWLLVARLETSGERREQNLRWLSIWSIKGILLPISFWGLINIGLSFSLQPFLPEIQFAQNSGKPWGSAFLQFVGYGLFIVSSYWTAVTLGWAIQKTVLGLEDEQRAQFKSLCLTCVLGLFLPAVGMAFLGGAPIMGFAAAIILAPLVGYAPNVLRAKKARPLYARAIARVKFGKYKEAEWEIIRELEKAQDDFDGWMMLAELYAKNFNDLAEAEQTVLEICDHPRTTPSQLSVALHRLSEWHLNLASNPYAARQALLMVCNRLPGTHLAHMAQLRINQLPETLDDLRELRNPRPIPLPAHPSDLSPADPASISDLDPRQAVETANACVSRLNIDPNDLVTREKLARLLVEHLNQVEQGLEQLLLLLNVSEVAEAKRAHWLSLAANWQMTRRHDIVAGRKYYQQLISEYPNSPEAVDARRRLQMSASARSDGG
jgi:hypothetical protein